VDGARRNGIVKARALFAAKRTIKRQANFQDVLSLPLFRIIPLDIHFNPFERNLILLCVPHGRMDFAGSESGVEIVMGAGRGICAAQILTYISPEGVLPNSDHLRIGIRNLSLTVDLLRH
jgi:hypothetical protein